jgi:NAD(P)-dependent dehydrogenase (short-subunit alcohol dehydrogenase family)
MKDLKGKTAFITGGASGIGLGIAKACAKEGMNIVIADFRQQAIDEALPLFKENGWPVLGVLLDVTDRAAFEKAADEAEAAFGKIHILVNNAGIGLREGKIWEASYEDIDFAIDINYKSVLNGIKTIVPRILKHGEGGHVVTTSSKNGLIPLPGMVLYNSTKRAVMAIMETLAIDLKGTGVGASVFCPGPFKTNLNTTTNELRAKVLGSPFKPVTPMPKPNIDMSKVDFSKLERSPDEAGERVLRGIKRGDLFILSHSEWKPGWEAHAAAITRAFPDEKPDENFMKVFGLNVYNPIYDEQTQVPAYKADK